MKGVFLLKNLYRILILAAIIFFTAGPELSSTRASIQSYKEIPIMQFPVMSDVHICGEPNINQGVPNCRGDANENFLKALKDYQMTAPGYKTIAIVGDLTNQGLENQYRKFMELLSTHANPGSNTLLAIGNHEFIENKYWQHPLLASKLLVSRFITETGMDNVYYDKWIGGYHFITLGSEGSFLGNHKAPYISNRQYRWLKQTLSQKAAANKPIFIFLHQPIRHTVFGSEASYADFKGWRLKKILRKYPQAFLFSGHSHYDLNNPKTVYQKGFTMVNTASVSYVINDKGRQAGLSQGLLVDVYKDRVEIKAREFSNRSWIRVISVPL
jgi:3',5'-cyclic-AMP phosphodiesterase